MEDARVAVNVSDANHANNTLALIVVLGHLVHFCIVRGFDCNGQAGPYDLGASSLDGLQLGICGLAWQVNVVHRTALAHPPAESVEVLMGVHDG